jgi:hypothetical protein
MKPDLKKNRKRNRFVNKIKNYMPEEQQKPHQNMSIPSVYFNGFGISISPTDINVVCLLNGQPIGSLNMAHITAKNLAKTINEILTKYSKDIGVKIDDYSTIEKRIKELNEKQNSAS